MKKHRFRRTFRQPPAPLEPLEPRLLLSTIFNLTQWVASTQGDVLAQQILPTAAPDPNTQPRTIALDPSQTYQTITGFGGAVNEQGWEALSTLSSTSRAAVMNSLFANTGAAFTFIRTPIGANDFSDNYYSLDDTPGDYSLSHFSIARDQQQLIPYIQAALQLNPNIQVWASPWTPPAWMKTNGNYAGGSLTWTAQNLQSYANYLADYVQAYQAAGIPVYAIQVQNEPISSQVFPSSTMTGGQMDQFIASYLGPTFAQRHINAQIWIGTINDNNYSDYGGVILADPTAAGYVSGIGYQWAGQYAIADARQANPTLPLMQTESEAGDGTNSWLGGQATFNFLLQDFNSGVNSYMYWNMVLNETATSSWGWQQNAMITVNRATGVITYNPDYYAMEQFAHYIQPGAKLISAASADWGDKAAFLNPDGTIVLEIGNSSYLSYTDTIRIAGDTRALSVTLPPQSFNTFIFTPSGQFIPGPTGLLAVPGASQIGLTWNPVAGATGYTIKRASAPSGPYTTVAITAPSYLDPKLTPGQTYYYAVSATSALGETSDSAQVWAIPTALPAPGISINSGGDAAGSFLADTDASAGTIATTTTAISTAGVANPAPQSVYQSERYGNFTYTIPNLSAGQTYVVRLHFAEIYWTAAGKRLFNVLINGTQVLTNFDIFAAAGGINIAVTRQFNAIASASGILTIQYVNVTDNAKSSGIEILLPTGTWTGLAGDNNWNNAANWAQNILPTQSDDVIIAPGQNTIQLASGTGSAHTLTAASPINIAGTLLLYGTSTFSDGLTLSGKLQLLADSSLFTVGGGLNLTGILDLRDNNLILQNTLTSAITPLLATGFANGAWNGTGIDSSFAATHPNQALGILSGSDYALFHYHQLFAGQTFQPTDTLIKFTYTGDATLSGSINIDDYMQIDRGYLRHLTGWLNGDFNYDGSINAQDYALIDAALASQGSPLAAAMIEQHTAMFGAAYASAPPAPAPAPTPTIQTPPANPPLDYSAPSSSIDQPPPMPSPPPTPVVIPSTVAPPCNAAPSAEWLPTVFAPKPTPAMIPAPLRAPEAAVLPIQRSLPALPIIQSLLASPLISNPELEPIPTLSTAIQTPPNARAAPANPIPAAPSSSTAIQETAIPPDDAPPSPAPPETPSADDWQNLTQWLLSLLQD